MKPANRRAGCDGGIPVLLHIELQWPAAIDEQR
jgi:hypothetical protein